MKRDLVNADARFLAAMRRMRSANQNWSLCAAHTANSYGSVGIHTRQHSRLIRDVRRGHSRGPPPSLLGVAAMARGQLTLEHARGPQRVEDHSVRSGGRGHSDVVHASLVIRIVVSGNVALWLAGSGGVGTWFGTGISGPPHEGGLRRGPASA